MLAPFSASGPSIALATTNVSADIAISQGVGKQIRIFNDSSALLYWKVGNGPQVVSGIDTFMAPGATEIFSIPMDVSRFAAAVVTGTGNVYAQCGNGI